MVYVLPVGLGDDLSEVSDTLPLHPSCYKIWMGDLSDE